MSNDFFLFLHSLLRYAVLLTVAFAGLTHLSGYLRRKPILNGERTIAIVAMVLCHVQLVVGLSLYIGRVKHYVTESVSGRFWKFEHIGMMIVAIALVTIGRMLSKRANMEPSKQLRVAVFYLIALAIFLWATPWPFTEYGHGRGWL
ncbi:MAG: cytochrome B [Flavobacteriales bacterium]|nr:cytochrome B [Flavobacteriales bacterium]